MWRLFLPRAVMGLLMLGYLFVSIASHWIPLSSVLEGPVALAGWLAIAVPLVFAEWLYRWLPDGDGVITRSGMRWFRIMHLAFFAAAGLAFCFAVTGNLSLACPQHATSCVKIDNWKMSGGHYYRQHPYDSAGDDDPGAAWVEISRPEYVTEVGTRVRQAAPFGVGMLCFAWVLYGGDAEYTGTRGSSRYATWLRWRRRPGRTGSGATGRGA